MQVDGDSRNSWGSSGYQHLSGIQSGGGSNIGGNNIIGNFNNININTKEQ